MTTMMNVQGKHFAKTFDPITQINWAHAWWTDGPQFKALGLSNNDPVSTWPDEISDWDFTQATPSYRPTFLTNSNINNKSAVKADGSNDYMITAGSISTAASIVIIMEASDNWADYTILGGSFWSDIQIRLPGGNRGLTVSQNSVMIQTGGGFYQGSPPILLVIRASGGAPYWSAELNGTQVTTTASSNMQITSELGVFARTQTMAEYNPAPVSFIGIHSGDVMADPNWSKFEDWCEKYYGININRFKPTDIPNGRIWMDASDDSTITQSNGLVSQWTDKFNGWNFIQNTNNEKPIVRSSFLGKKNVLEFTSKEVTYDAGSDVIDLSPVTTFIIAYPGNPQTYGRLLSGRRADNATGDHQSPNFIGAARQNADELDWNSAGPGVATNCGYTPNNWFIYESFGDGTNLYHRINGGTEYSSASTSLPANMRFLRIGASCDAVDSPPPRSSTGWWDGYIAEIIVYNATLTVSEREQVRRYLQKKWLLPDNGSEVLSMRMFGKDKSDLYAVTPSLDADSLIMHRVFSR